MKNIAWLFSALLLLLIAFTMRDFKPSVLLEAGPWWVYFVLAGILYSGYMAYKYYKEDRKYDEEHIEREGERFLSRLNLDHERKRHHE